MLRLNDALYYDAAGAEAQIASWLDSAQQAWGSTALAMAHHPLYINGLIKVGKSVLIKSGRR